MIKIVGIGPGNPEYMTLAAVNNILSAEILAGAERNVENAFELFRSVGKEGDIAQTEVILLKTDMQKFIKEVSGNTEKDVVVIVSGDPGFYSLLDTFNSAKVKVEAVPGISSFQYLYSKLGLSYKNHRLLSCHGRDTDFVKILGEDDGVFLLTDGENTPPKICKRLVTAGFGNAKVHIGANLSYDNEEIVSGLAKDFVESDFSILSSVIVEKG